MSIAFEEGGNSDDPFWDLDQEEVDQAFPLVDFQDFPDERDSPGKILSDRSYKIKNILPSDLVVDEAHKLPVVHVVTDLGERLPYFIREVWLLPRPRPSLSPPDSVVVFGQPGPESFDAEYRRRESWKLRGVRPYRILVQEIVNDGRAPHLFWTDVRDVEFPGGDIPHITQLAHGTPWKSDLLTGDSGYRDPPEDQHGFLKTREDIIHNALQKLVPEITETKENPAVVSGWIQYFRDIIRRFWDGE